jgi:hypothetical protein
VVVEVGVAWEGVEVRVLVKVGMAVKVVAGEVVADLREQQCMQVDCTGANQHEDVKAVTASCSENQDGPCKTPCDAPGFVFLNRVPSLATVCRQQSMLFGRLFAD